MKHDSITAFALVFTILDYEKSKWNLLNSSQISDDTCAFRTRVAISRWAGSSSRKCGADNDISRLGRIATAVG